MPDLSGRTLRGGDIKPGDTVFVARRLFAVASIDDDVGPEVTWTAVTDPGGGRHSLGIWRHLDYLTEDPEEASGS